MSKKNRKRRSRKNKNKLIFKIIAVISTLIFIIFSILLYVLDMVPFKYLIIFYVVFILLYLGFNALSFLKNIKNKYRIIATIFFVLFGLIFCLGIKYLNDTINFMDVINNGLFQKEEYYLMVLKDCKYEKINELDGYKIGIYASKNSEKAYELLSKKVSTNNDEYKDVVEMFEDLEEGKISAVLIGGSTKNLLDTELADMKLELKEIYTVSVPIKEVDIVKVVDVTKKPFNIYVAGGDAYGSIDNVTNTDVNMVITVDPVNKKILLTSIPRDYYVNLPSFGEDAYDKLTHAGYYGIEESVMAIENLLDIDINYYVKVNFSTIEGIIDAIGGVDVYSDYNFCLGNSNTCFKKGLNKLNGADALMFARERHSFKDGDVQRVKNQQKVLEAIINKATSSTAIVTNFSQILDSVSNNFSTNIDTKSLNRLVKMQLNSMSSWNIETQNLSGTDYNSTVYTFPTQKLYVMKQDDESVKNAIEKIKGYLN